MLNSSRPGVISKQAVDRYFDFCEWLLSVYTGRLVVDRGIFRQGMTQHSIVDETA